MPPKGNVQDVLAKFRSGMVKAAKIQSDAAKEREQKLKKVQGGGTKKPSASRPSKSRAKTATSSGPAGSTEAPSGIQPAQGDWRTQAPKALLPLGMRQKQVIDYLRQCETAATAAEIAAATGRDPKAEPDLAAALDANPKVAVDANERTYAYLPDANVRDREQLLDFICRAGAPVAMSEIADAYRAVADDVAALKAEGAIMGLHSFDPEVGCEVLFAVDAKLAGMECDTEVAALWQSVEVPEDDDEVAEELRRAGLVPAPRKAPRQRSEAERKKKRKQRKATKLRAVTNVHLMHLLEGAAPASLDNMDAC